MDKRNSPRSDSFVDFSVSDNPVSQTEREGGECVPHDEHDESEENRVVTVNNPGMEGAGPTHSACDWVKGTDSNDGTSEDFRNDESTAEDEETVTQVTETAMKENNIDLPNGTGTKYEEEESESQRHDSTFNVDTLSYELQVGYKILCNLMSTSNKFVNKLFMHPVDDSFPETADYYEKIKEPMWMTKMKEKFENNGYTDVTDFVSDFRLMIENCYRFNGPDNFVSKKAQKLETMFKQKVQLLSRELRDKMLGANPQDDDLLATAGVRRRIRNPNLPLEDSSQQLLSQLRRDRAMQEREDRRQKVEDRKAMEQARIQELQDWEDKFMGPEIKQQIRTMWELPQLGMFIYLCMESLGLEEEITQYQLERGLVAPRECSDFRRLMTCLLSTPHQRKSLKGFMPYHVWNQKLSTKLDLLYKVLAEKGGNQAQACYKLGLDSRAFQILGTANPLHKKKFHELSFLKRVWVLKSYCDYCMETQPYLQKSIEEVEAARPMDVREVLLGSDVRGNRYINFPMFTGKDIRIYRHAKHSEPSLESLGLEDWRIDSDKPSASSSRCSTPVNQRTSRTSLEAATSLRARAILQAAESKEASPLPDTSHVAGSEPGETHEDSNDNANTPNAGKANSAKKRKKSFFTGKRKRLKSKKEPSHLQHGSDESSKCDGWAEEEREKVGANQNSASGDKGKEHREKSASIPNCDKSELSTTSAISPSDSGQNQTSMDIDEMSTKATNLENKNDMQRQQTDKTTAIDVSSDNSEVVIASQTLESSSPSSTNQPESALVNGVTSSRSGEEPGSPKSSIGQKKSSLLDTNNSVEDHPVIDDARTKDGQISSSDCDTNKLLNNSNSNSLSAKCEGTKSGSVSFDEDSKMNCETSESLTLTNHISNNVDMAKAKDVNTESKSNSITPKENGFVKQESHSGDSIKAEDCDESPTKTLLNIVKQEKLQSESGKDSKMEVDMKDCKEEVKKEGEVTEFKVKKEEDCKTEAVKEELRDVKQEEKEEESEEEEDLPDLGHIDLVAESMEEIRALMTKFSNPEPIKRGKKTYPGVLKPCEEELLNSLTQFHDELSKYERSLFNARTHAQSKLRKEVESYVEPKLEESKGWDSEHSEASKGSSDGEEEAEEEDTPAEHEGLRKSKRTKAKASVAATTALLSSAANKLSSISGDDKEVNEDSNDSFELDISSRGRLRKRRIIPNNTEDTGIKKRKNYPFQDAFFNNTSTTASPASNNTATVSLSTNQASPASSVQPTKTCPSQILSMLSSGTPVNQAVKTQVASQIATSSPGAGQILRLISPGAGGAVRTVRVAGKPNVIISPQNLANLRFISSTGVVTLPRNRIVSATSAQTSHPVIQQLLLNQSKTSLGSQGMNTLTTSSVSGATIRPSTSAMGVIGTGGRILTPQSIRPQTLVTPRGIRPGGALPSTVKVSLVLTSPTSSAAVRPAGQTVMSPSGPVVVTQVSSAITSTGGKQVLDLGSLSVTQIQQLVKNQAIQIHTGAGQPTTLLLTTGLQQLGSQARAVGGVNLNTLAAVSGQALVQQVVPRNLQPSSSVAAPQQILLNSKLNPLLTISRPAVPQQGQATVTVTLPQSGLQNVQGNHTVRLGLQPMVQAQIVSPASSQTVRPTASTILRPAGIPVSSIRPASMPGVQMTPQVPIASGPRIISSLQPTVQTSRVTPEPVNSRVTTDLLNKSQGTVTTSGDANSLENGKPKIITVPLANLSPLSPGKKKYASNVTVKTLLESRTGQNRRPMHDESSNDSTASQGAANGMEKNGVNSSGEKLVDTALGSESSSGENNTIASSTLSCSSESGMDFTNSNNGIVPSLSSVVSSSIAVSKACVTSNPQPLTVDTVLQPLLAPSVQVTLPTMTMKVPSPNTLPSLTHNKHSTTIVQSNKVPIPTASEASVSEQSSVVPTFATNTIGLASAATPATILTSSLAKPPITPAAKNVMLKVMPQSGGSGHFVQGYVTSKGLVIPQSALVQQQQQLTLTNNSPGVVLCSTSQPATVGQTVINLGQQNAVIGGSQIQGMSGNTVTVQTVGNSSAQSGGSGILNSTSLASVGNTNKPTVIATSVPNNGMEAPGFKLMLVNQQMGQGTSLKVGTTGSDQAPTSTPASELVKQIASNTQAPQVKVRSPGETQIVSNNNVQQQAGRTVINPTALNVQVSGSNQNFVASNQTVVASNLAAQLLSLQQNNPSLQIQSQGSVGLTAKPDGSQAKPSVVTLQLQQLGQLLGMGAQLQVAGATATDLNGQKSQGTTTKVLPSGQLVQFVNPGQVVVSQQTGTILTQQASPQALITGQSANAQTMLTAQPSNQTNILTMQPSNSQAILTRQPTNPTTILTAQNVNPMLNLQQAIPQKIVNGQTIIQSSAPQGANLAPASQSVQSQATSNSSVLLTTGQRLPQQQIVQLPNQLNSQFQMAPRQSLSIGTPLAQMRTQTGGIVLQAGQTVNPQQQALQPHIGGLQLQANRSELKASGILQSLGSTAKPTQTSLGSTPQIQFVLKSSSMAPGLGNTLPQNVINTSGLPRAMVPPQGTQLVRMASSAQGVPMMAQGVRPSTSPPNNNTTVFVGQSAPVNKPAQVVIQPGSAVTGGPLLISPLKVAPQSPRPTNLISPIKLMNPLSMPTSSAQSQILFSSAQPVGQILTSAAPSIKPGVIYASQPPAVKTDSKVAQILLSSSQNVISQSTKPSMSPAPVSSPCTVSSGSGDAKKQTLLYKIGDQYFCPASVVSLSNTPAASNSPILTTATTSKPEVKLLVPPASIEASDLLARQSSAQMAKASVSGQQTVVASNGLAASTSLSSSQSHNGTDQKTVQVNGVYNNSQLSPASNARPNMSSNMNGQYFSPSQADDSNNLSGRRNTFSGSETGGSVGKTVMPQRHQSTEERCLTTEELSEKEAALNLLTFANQGV